MHMECWIAAGCRHNAGTMLDQGQAIAWCHLPDKQASTHQTSQAPPLSHPPCTPTSTDRLLPPRAPSIQAAAVE